MNCAFCGHTMPDPPSPIELAAIEFPGLPVAEAVKRGWFGDPDTILDADEMRRRVLAFFNVDSVAEYFELLRQFADSHQEKQG